MEIFNKEIHVTQISLNGNFGLHDSYTSFPKWKLVAIIDKFSAPKGSGRVGFEGVFGPDPKLKIKLA